MNGTILDSLFCKVVKTTSTSIGAEGGGYSHRMMGLFKSIAQKYGKSHTDSS